MAHVALVDPPIQRRYRFKYVNHGLISIAGVLLRLGHSVEFSDKYVPCDFCCISATSAQYLKAISIAREAKCNGSVTILGGHHATVFGEEASSPAFDYIVIGDGEYAVVEIIEGNAQWKRSPSGNTKIVFGKDFVYNDGVFWGRRKVSLPDMKQFYSLGDTASLVKRRMYSWDGYGWTYSNRVKNNSAIVLEVSSIISSGVTDLVILDNSFGTWNKKIATFEQSLRGMQSWECRVDARDVVRKHYIIDAIMSFDKCTCVEIVILSGDDGLLLQYGFPPISVVDDAISGVREKKNIRWVVMPGVPGETEKTMLTTIDRMRDRDVVVEPYIPWPGSTVLDSLDDYIVIGYDYHRYTDIEYQTWKSSRLEYSRFLRLLSLMTNHTERR